jgi:hypothetical protein
MAHFALVNSDGIVETVQVVNNDVLDASGEFPESEASGQAFQASLGLAREDAVWLQTSYNGNFRGNYAGIGFTYDEALDAFIPPKPGPTDEISDWLLNEQTFTWEPVEA